ncbi:MAG: hypothetical protein JAY75_04625 [Candidatus Thiodiazotropha taylori]|nr:hypothetical protein [Candidatus Thiodiazotropha taylori]MCW4307491.1 hypothetical protein [Candidatus Thiodiazotropha endolucinida]
MDNILDHGPEVTGCLQQQIEDIVEHVHIVREIAKKNIIKHQQDYKNRHDKKARLPHFHVGQHVYLTVENYPSEFQRNCIHDTNGHFTLRVKITHTNSVTVQQTKHLNSLCMQTG